MSREQRAKNEDKKVFESFCDILDGDTSHRDWPEDSHLENGNYNNRCFFCGHTFTGHKRRMVCRACGPN